MFQLFWIYVSPFFSFKHPFELHLSSVLLLLLVVMKTLSWNIH